MIIGVIFLVFLFSFTYIRAKYNPAVYSRAASVCLLNKECAWKAIGKNKIARETAQWIHDAWQAQAKVVSGLFDFSSNIF